jgi:tRNA(Ile)-lysidine synthase
MGDLYSSHQEQTGAGCPGLVYIRRFLGYNVPLFRKPMKTTALLRKVAKTIRDHRMILPGDRVLIAYSGGADSTFLAFSLLRLREHLDISLALAHFNHKLRPGADEDERFVRDAANSWGLPLTVGAGDVRAYARRKRLNLEEAGRRLRYRFLETTAGKIDAQRIATGHTLNDQAETFLIRLFRGAGLEGLSGIHPNLDDRIIRPLIGIEKSELLEALGREGVGHREDPSNRDRRFLRNRIRFDILPRLQGDIDGSLIRRLGGTANLLADDEDLLRKLATEALAVHGREKGLLQTSELARLDRGLARRIVREFIRRDCGGLRGMTRADVENILDMKDGKNLRLHGGIRLRKERGRIRVLPEEAPPPAETFSLLWDGTAPLRILQAGLLISADVPAREEMKARDFDDEAGVFLDRDKLAFPLEVRSPQSGDLFHPLGSPGHKKLKEAFRDRDVAPSERPARPVFLSGDEIIWVLGLPVGEKYKITSSTRRVLHIIVRPFP